jgi:anti-sigma-K factor RskA
MSTDDTEFTPSELEKLGVLARTLTPEDFELDEPPADLWGRIEEAVRDADADADDGPSATGRVSALRQPSGAQRRPLWRRTGLLAAAAALIAIAFGVVLLDDEGTQSIAAVELRSENLDPLGADSSGRAKLVRLADGTLALDIRVSNLPDPGNGFLELWVIDPAVEGMVSLGPLRGSGRFPLPEAVDPSAFPIVDISVEPADGVPTHSGRSILRGVIET